MRVSVDARPGILPSCPGGGHASKSGFLAAPERFNLAVNDLHRPSSAAPVSCSRSCAWIGSQAGNDSAWDESHMQAALPPPFSTASVNGGPVRL